MGTGRVLFISRDGTRTGAPLLLLHYLQWLKSEDLLPFEVLLHHGGELEDQFRELAPTTVLARPANGPLGWRTPRYNPEEIALIYCNTLANHELLLELAHLKRPVVT